MRCLTSAPRSRPSSWVSGKSSTAELSSVSVALCQISPCRLETVIYRYVLHMKSTISC